jgi:hypothetical protein
MMVVMVMVLMVMMVVMINPIDRKPGILLCICPEFTTARISVFIMGSRFRA